MTDHEAEVRLRDLLDVLKDPEILAVDMIEEYEREGYIEALMIVLGEA